MLQTTNTQKKTEVQQNYPAQKTAAMATKLLK